MGSLERAVWRDRPIRSIDMIIQVLILQVSSVLGGIIQNINKPYHGYHAPSIIPYLQYPVPSIKPYLGYPLLHWGGPRVIVDPDTEHNCTEPGSFPHKSDCSRFYTCNSIGDMLLGFTFLCPPGLLYNSTAELCDWPHRVNCTNETNDSLSLQPAAKIATEDNQVVLDVDDKFTCPTVGSFPVPTSCAYYYLCTQEEGQLQALELPCPPSLLFSRETLSCETVDLVSCDLSHVEEDICTAESLTSEEKILCSNNAWKHTDQFILL